MPYYPAQITGAITLIIAIIRGVVTGAGNHPDRHIAAGVPEELITIATDRLAAINSAYEVVARERGL